MNITRSASCSIEPDSRRSERIGRLSWRCSTARESCDIARIGTSRSRASTLRFREMCDTSFPRFSAVVPGAFRAECAAHQLQALDDDQPEDRLARLYAAGLRTDLHHRDRARVVDVD